MFSQQRSVICACQRIPHWLCCLLRVWSRPFGLRPFRKRSAPNCFFYVPIFFFYSAFGVSFCVSANLQAALTHERVAACSHPLRRYVPRTAGGRPRCVSRQLLPSRRLRECCSCSAGLAAHGALMCARRAVRSVQQNSELSAVRVRAFLGMIVYTVRRLEGDTGKEGTILTFGSFLNSSYEFRSVRATVRDW